MFASLFQQLNCSGPTICGGPFCGKEDEKKKKEGPVAGVFELHPLGHNAHPDAEEATQRGVRLLHEGRTHEALRELHAAQRYARSSHEVCSNLGCAYHMSGNDESAISWYREAQCMAPHDETAVLALAWLEAKRGMVDEAQWLLVNFLQEVNKSHVGALKQLAKIHEQERDWSQAAGVYNRLIAAEPSSQEWRGQLQQCLDQMPLGADSRNAGFGGTGGGGGGGTISSQLQEAARMRENGSTDQALTLYKAVLRQNDRSTEALLGMADCQGDLGENSAALESVKQLLSQKPESAEGNLLMGELLLKSGHSADEAENYVRRASNDSRAGPGVQLRVLCATAEIALAREDFVQALKSAAEAVRIDASAPRALVLLGTVRVCVAEYPAALRTLSAAVDASTNKNTQGARCLAAQAHALMAQAYERQREYSQALQSAGKSLDLEPTMSKAKVSRALALAGTGRGAEAETELGQILQRSPQNAPARLALGYMQLSREDPKAVATLEAVITGSSASRSMLGAAKVYLALALESLNMSRASARSDRVLKEGLQLHRNLQHVWAEVEQGLGDQPMEAVQRLRGICDLDLTSMQARLLLTLLARSMGRSDLSRALAAVTPPRQRPGVQRQASVPPRRQAPISFDQPGMPPPSPLARHRSMSPAPWDANNMSRASSLVVASSEGHMGGSMQFPRSNSSAQAQPGGRPNQPFGGRSPMSSQQMQRPSGDHSRGRSMSPSPWGAIGGSSGGSFQIQNSGGYPNNSGSYRSSSRERQPNNGNFVELGLNEVIRPEQLVFGPPLGSGGSAQVYRGSWQGQEVAIKKISGVAHLEEMTKEINALRRLRHPRLVRFIGACIQPPLLLVVTEFMSGGSLYDRLFERKGQPLTSPQRNCIAVQMTEGLAYLHHSRIVHRDLKSMNILLDGAGNAKICDFGLAQQMKVESTHITRKNDGEGGSPRYMAPECYDPCHGKLTEKVDVWALGCILIEVFAGVLPYADCVTMAQLSARILVQKRPPDVPSSVKPALAAIIRSLLQFDEQKRPTASEVLKQLSKHAQ